MLYLNQICGANIENDCWCVAHRIQSGIIYLWTKCFVKYLEQEKIQARSVIPFLVYEINKLLQIEHDCKYASLYQHSWSICWLHQSSGLKKLSHAVLLQIVPMHWLSVCSASNLYSSTCQSTRVDIRGLGQNWHSIHCVKCISHLQQTDIQIGLSEQKRIWQVV